MSPQNDNFHNVIYAIVQVVHNFGAVGVFGGYLAPMIIKTAEMRNKAIRYVLAGWGIQGASGAAFGMTSLLFYQRFPDISKIGTVMLTIKIFCVAVGFTMIGAYAIRGASWKENIKNLTWFVSSALAVIALTAAAFLRWFS